MTHYSHGLIARFATFTVGRALDPEQQRAAPVPVGLAATAHPRRSRHVWWTGSVPDVAAGMGRRLLGVQRGWAPQDKGAACDGQVVGKFGGRRGSVAAAVRAAYPSRISTSCPTCMHQHWNGPNKPFRVLTKYKSDGKIKSPTIAYPELFAPYKGKGKGCEDKKGESATRNS